MQMGVQRRAKAMDKAHGTAAGIVGRAGTAGLQRRFDFGEENPQDCIDQPGIMVEKIAHACR